MILFWVRYSEKYPPVLEGGLSSSQISSSLGYGEQVSVNLKFHTSKYVLNSAITLLFLIQDTLNEFKKFISRGKRLAQNSLVNAWGKFCTLPLQTVTLDFSGRRGVVHFHDLCATLVVHSLTQSL